MSLAKFTIHLPSASSLRYRGSAFFIPPSNFPPVAAFRESIADVREGRFPERSHLVEMEAPFLDEVVRSIGGAASQIMEEGK